MSGGDRVGSSLGNAPDLSAVVMFWWAAFLDNRAYIDLVALIIVGAVHAIAWSGTGRGWPTDPDSILRSVQSLTAAATGGLTAVGILLPATLVAVQIGHPSRASIEPIFFADTWFTLSLLFGIYVLFIVGVRGSRENVLNGLMSVGPTDGSYLHFS